ncbi:MULTISPECIES: DUF6093 family protein [unclassified Curtobacterium]|uniref:DUF6093 family protein n=1 Tax=unclassified Curtobacterium TaxID=257496 RepID=UPI003A7FB2A3
MSIITGTLTMGRRWAETRMTDTCRITRQVKGPQNEQTGKTVLVPETVYEGPCEFKAEQVQATDTEQSGQLLVTQDATLKLPIATSTAVTKGYDVEILTSLTDPGLVGVRARVVGPFASAYTTARRFPVTVTT